MDEVDVYHVGVRLNSGEDVPLFRFVGDGSVETGWFGVIFCGDDVVDLEGTQYHESRSFVDILSQLVGKGVTPTHRR